MSDIVECFSVGENVVEFILRDSSRHFPNETGGILVGKFQGNCALIQHATGPGPVAQHLQYAFRRDGKHSQLALDKVVSESDGALDYIGEWHSHPLSSGPSPRDVWAMRWIAKNRKYAVKSPIMGLCIKTTDLGWQLKFYVYGDLKLRELKDFQTTGG